MKEHTAQVPLMDNDAPGGHRVHVHAMRLAGDGHPEAQRRRAISHLARSGEAVRACVLHMPLEEAL